MIDDALRPPPPTDPDAPAYKDWLHLNVFDHATGAVGLFNTSLHGAPTEPASRTIGAALLHIPGVGWAGNVAVRGFDETVIGANSIAIDQLAIAVDPSHDRVLVSATYPDDGFGATLSARAATRPLAVEERMPFGKGWISWYVVPRLTMSGSVVASGMTIDMARATGYHDHNWGRWHWGDDVGWEWAALVAEAPGPALILSRTTNRDHRRAGQPMLVVEHGALRRRFAGMVTITFEGNFDAPLRRLPGAMAALHQDRARPLLPLRVQIRASDGIDSVEVMFTTRAAAQLIAADPSRRGYGFVHELVGSFSGRITVAGEIVNAHGLGVFEYVQ